MRQERTSYQRWMTIIVLLLLVALTGFMIAGCSGGGSKTKTEGQSTGETVENGGEHAGGEAAEGEESEETLSEQAEAQEARVSDEKDASLLYINNCGACHGHDGSGVIGPAIKGTSLSTEQIQKTVENGITEGGTELMPKFKGGELSDEQIVIITEYIKKELK